MGMEDSPEGTEGGEIVVTHLCVFSSRGFYFPLHDTGKMGHKRMAVSQV